MSEPHDQRQGRQLGSLAKVVLANGVLLLSCSGQPSSVVRAVDGEHQEGRFVSHVSYSAYTRSAQLEAAGELDAAMASYQEALRYDPNSPQIWTRLGAVSCRSHAPDATVAFDTAERLDNQYAPLFYERARCLLSRGNAELALESGKRALELDPSHFATTELIANTYIALGRYDDAARYLDALLARHPHLRDSRHWRDVLERVRQRSNTGLQAHQGDTAFRALDRALLHDDLPKARQVALELGLSLTDIAARALLLGHPRTALEQAKQVRAADPTNGTAWAIELAAADLLGDEAAFEAALGAVAGQPTAPEGLGRVLFAELLERRLGAEPASVWLELAPSDSLNHPLLNERERKGERDRSVPRAPNGD